MSACTSENNMEEILGTSLESQNSIACHPRILESHELEVTPHPKLT
jgi:hypothetical protein